MKEAIYSRTVIHILLIIVLGLIAYSNTIHVPFYFDDSFNIVENNKLKDLSNFWPPSGTRWFGFLTFAINYYFGGLNVVGYHVVNIAIHILNAILVYWLVMLTFKTPYLKVSVISVSEQTQKTDTVHYSLIALFSALIFVSHPIQTQAVTYIVQRFTSLAALFYLLSLVMYIKARLLQQSAVSYVLYLTRYTLYAVSLISAVLAMKTKEIAFTLPIIIILYEFMFLVDFFKRRLIYLIPILLTIFIIPVTLLGIDKPIGEMIGDVSKVSKIQTEMSRLSYLFTQFRAIVTYIRLLILPIHQNFDYDYPIYNSILNPNVFLSFLFLLSIFGLGVYLFYRSRFTPPFNSPLIKGGLRGVLPLQNSTRYPLHATRLISFGIFWFFITLSVESSIIPISDVIYEHRLYLPCIGIIVAFTSAIFYFVQYIAVMRHASRGMYYISALLIILTIVFSITTYKRNNIWKDELTLWEDVVRKSPYKQGSHYSLGSAYYKQGRLNEALNEYRTILDMNPYSKISLIARTNIGLIYADQEKLGDAIRECKTALKLQADYPEAHFALGFAYYKQGLKNEAIQEYMTATRLKPDYAEAHDALGFAYYKQGLINEAIQEYTIAISVKPNRVKTHINIGDAYVRLGEIDRGIMHYQAALKLNPDLAETHNNLGLAYKQKGLIDEAMREFQEALRIQPDFIEARQNLESLQR